RDRIGSARDREHQRGRSLQPGEELLRRAGGDRRIVVVWHDAAQQSQADGPSYLAQHHPHCQGANAARQHFTRFCSRSTAVLTPADARGYLRPTSPKAAQAASFSFNAASDWPSRSSASGALADLSYLVVTARKASAESRYCW